MNKTSLKFWLGRRKRFEAQLLELTMKTKRKSARFVSELKRINKELEDCTTEINNRTKS